MAIPHIVCVMWIWSCPSWMSPGNGILSRNHPATLLGEYDIGMRGFRILNEFTSSWPIWHPGIYEPLRCNVFRARFELIVSRLASVGFISGTKRRMT